MADFSDHIDALDGLHVTLTADRIGPWDVMIGGGPEWFVLTATAGTHSVNALAFSDGRDEGTVDLTVGGQAVDYPARYVLGRDAVDAAIRELAHAPRADDLPSARWER
ncbi:Imm1 family immunity protein [Leucobacter chromiireducens]|uniref:Uncharacterized protein n=1 Tax=Leucobacter chromiireducens subsp. solipictus TaxID=398235 RepID=A0ABS1SBM4_9MICO|nr:Imm1 family immunity protein [Leucobacter chromiireducens]MBL3677936.1 hypothetical protein [Leucobacter chromiireducens subsp. solipictus]